MIRVMFPLIFIVGCSPHQEIQFPVEETGEWVVVDSRRFLNYEVRWSEPKGVEDWYRVYSYHGDKHIAELQAVAMNELDLTWNWDIHRTVEEQNNIREHLRETIDTQMYMD